MADLPTLSPPVRAFGRVQVGRRCSDEELIVSTCLRQLNQLRFTNPLGNPSSRSGSQTVDPRRIRQSLENGPFGTADVRICASLLRGQCLSRHRRQKEINRFSCMYVHIFFWINKFLLVVTDLRAIARVKSLSWMQHK